jgi:xanthine dehydrogenase D subunit
VTALDIVAGRRGRSKIGGVGVSVARPDGDAKVQGTFSFSSDLNADGMLWGATLRSPHPHARIVSIDVSAAWLIAGVECVLTADDVPGAATYGLLRQDQPVFARDFVRYHGEPVAAVAADHPETCRRAVDAIVVTYEVLTPLTDAEAAVDGSAPDVHPDGNIFGHQKIVCGDQQATGDVVVEGTYELGIQDQAFLGLEAALALPDPGGAGVELFVATQSLHEDRDQIAECLGLPHDKVRLVLGGVGGAFGGREDLTLQIHTCLLALRTGRPVKISYSREESFYGHVHRHPARLWMRHHANRDGTIVRLETRIVLDGGAYASTSPAVLLNAITHAQGPYVVPNAYVDGWAVRTNNPPCGAMRGFGVVQACFAHESQMDKLADACGLSPLEVRRRNAIATGDRLITGQVLENPAPVLRLLDELEAMPLPPAASDDVRSRPGGTGLTADTSHVRRGVGYGVTIKNMMYSAGADDFATAHCTLLNGVATLHFATAEVGQGFVMIAGQIARSVLGVDDVQLDAIDTRAGNAGSTSASRQTWMSGGAVDGVCRMVRERLFERVGAEWGVSAVQLASEAGDVFDTLNPTRRMSIASATATGISATFEHHHRPTEALDENGQGACHVAYAFAAHRAVVDVDTELGLVKVVQIATTQDVGFAINPLSVIGQIEGGIAQGLGLAIMEEIVTTNGLIRNPSFTDYLLPTALDAPDVLIGLVEEPDPMAPLGAKGVGEPPCISVTPAIVAAIRAVCGRELPRVPVRPLDICG